MLLNIPITKEQNHLSFGFINKQKYIIIKSNLITNYFHIPKEIIFSKTKEELVFSNCPKNFSSSLLNWIKHFDRPFKKVLILKGLGLKVIKNTNSQTLELKLGFSHAIIIKIPNNIFIKINKNIIRVESSNSVELGNFIYKVRILKFPNPYTGKGIWYKSEHRVLKIIKKK